MSVNCRRMNLTFSRSVRSRICAFVSPAAAAWRFAFAMAEDCYCQLFGPSARLIPTLEARCGLRVDGDLTDPGGR